MEKLGELRDKADEWGQTSSPAIRADEKAGSSVVRIGAIKIGPVAHVDAFGTLAARIGVAAGRTGRSLLYVKGGAAWEDRSIAATLNSALGPFPPIVSPASTSTSETRWGWTVGAGIEQALFGGWSVKAEYGYLNFDSAVINTPAGLTKLVRPPFSLLPA